MQLLSWGCGMYTRARQKALHATVNYQTDHPLFLLVFSFLSRPQEDQRSGGGWVRHRGQIPNWSLPTTTPYARLSVTPNEVTLAAVKCPFTEE